MTNNFWKNISRYPRFFISATTGLILIILTPLKNLLKNNKYKPIIVAIILLIITLLYLILVNMLSI